jgi:stress response protein SCP2
MINIPRGFRGKVEEYWDFTKDLNVALKITGPSVYDSACFGLDASDKLSDDAYMVFYNQTSSPNGEIVLEKSGNDSLYRFNLSKLPPRINKLAFTISVDGDGVLSQAGSVAITISQKEDPHGGKKEDVTLNLSGGDFEREKSLIGIEIYKKDVWRFAAVASGFFDGGLSILLKHFGGEEAESSGTSSPPLAPTTPLPSPSPLISLETRLEKEAPELTALAKPLNAILENKKLSGLVARVGLVLDISGSMKGKYRDGRVQDVVGKIIPLAVKLFEGELDLWYYGSQPKRMEPVTLKNYRTLIADSWEEVVKSHGGATNEREIMKLVLDEYGSNKIPALVLFITDGAVRRESDMKKQLKEASSMPIFFQFVGLGGRSYGILERLDAIKGSSIDNVNFFAINSFKDASDEDLYDKLLDEFSKWLDKALRKGVI